MSCELEITPGGGIYCIFNDVLDKNVVFLVYDFGAIGYEIFKTECVVGAEEITKSLLEKKYPYAAMKIEDPSVEKILLSNGYDRVINVLMTQAVVYKFHSHKDPQYHTFDHLGNERSLGELYPFR